MPAQTDVGADAETTNRQSQHAASGTKGVLGGDTKASSQKASQMAPTTKVQPVTQTGSHGDAIDPTDANDHNTSTSDRAGRTREGFLQVPDGGNNRNSVRPVETSIWDWDTPLESVGESYSSYYFEPQGELLQEQRDLRSLKGEYSIPTAVGGSGVNWPFSNTNGKNSNDTFAIPKRPPGNPLAIAGVKRKSTIDQPAEKRATRTMSAASESGEEGTSPVDARPSTHRTRSQAGPATRSRSGTEAAESTQRSQFADVDQARPALSISGSSAERRTLADSTTPMVLPPRKVFPIQIGDRLFRLSGASISSDAPSYFSQFFEEQLRQNEGADNVRTLYIDRDPATFEDISLHLQGYHVEPRDGTHFVKLFADAQFFSLPRLTAQLFSSTIYIRIGDEEFQIPRDLFSNPGDSPNYFSLGFSIFFTTPNDVFPGLSERTLLRPPSILPPSIPNKSAKTFADLLHILKGYPVEIRSEGHRQELLRDARYFHLKGLEQRIIPHQITYNLARKRTEILMRLEDIRQSGISFVGDSAAGTGSAAASPASSTTSSPPSGPGWIYYQRPYVDSEAFSLIIEMAGEENTFLSVEAGPSSSTARMCRATFFKQTLSRITSLFSVIASKMNLPITQPLGLMMLERGAGVASLPVSPRNTGMSEERVKVRIGPDADVVVDGKTWTVGAEDDEDSAMEVDSERSSRTGSKRRRRDDPSEEDGEEWIVKKAQWRLRVQPMTGGAQSGRSGMEVILGAVKIEAFSNERTRNCSRAFLS